MKLASAQDDAKCEGRGLPVPLARRAHPREGAGTTRGFGIVEGWMPMFNFAQKRFLEVCAKICRTGQKSALTFQGSSPTSRGQDEPKKFTIVLHEE